MKATDPKLTGAVPRINQKASSATDELPVVSEVITPELASIGTAATLAGLDAHCSGSGASSGMAFNELRNWKPSEQELKDRPPPLMQRPARGFYAEAPLALSAEGIQTRVLARSHFDPACSVDIISIPEGVSGPKERAAVDRRFFVSQGKAKVELDDQVFTLLPFEEAKIPAGVSHRITAVEGPLVYASVATPFLIEGDIERLKPAFRRPNAPDFGTATIGKQPDEPLPTSTATRPAPQMKTQGRQPFDESRGFTTEEGCQIIEVGNHRLDPACSIDWVRVPPGLTTGKHALAIDERYLILRGSATMHLGDDSFRVGTLDLVSIPKGTPQNITNDGAEPLVFVCICTPHFDVSDYTHLADPFFGPPRSEP